MTNGAPVGFSYRAFISYSHSDESWARWLIRKLEGYRVPQDLVGQTTPDGIVVPAKLGTFFRDRDEASAADNLTVAIRNALENSEHLIVIASPSAARSKYVDTEIREFAELNGKRGHHGKILTLIADGEPNSDIGQSSLECLPPSLRGDIKSAEGTPYEPLAADGRPTGDGKTRALSKLVAGLLGVRYDALVRRDLKRRQRLRIAVGSIICAIVVAIGAVVWKIESDQRERERIESDRRTVGAVSSAEHAKTLLVAGNVESAIKFARTSLPNDGSLPFIPQAYSTLYAALFQVGAPVSFEIGDFNTEVIAFPLVDHQYLTWTDNGHIKIWSPTRGINYSADLAPSFLKPVSTTDHGAVFVSDDTKELRYRVQDRTWDKIDFSSLNFNGMEPSALFAVDASTLLACSDKKIFELHLPLKGDGDPEVAWQVATDFHFCKGITRTDQGFILAGFDDGEVVLEFDPKTKSQIRRYENAATGGILDFEAHGDRLEVRGIEKTAIFHLGTADPPLTIKTRSATSIVSPNGHYAVEDGINTNQLEIYNLAEGKQSDAPCSFCRVIGFDGEETLITLEGETLVSRQLPAGNARATLFTFKPDVQRAIFVHEGHIGIGIRDVEPETIIRVTEHPSGILVNRSSARNYSLVSADFVTDDAVALTETTLGTGNNPFSGRVVRSTAAGAETVWKSKIGGPRGYGRLMPLGHGLMAIIKPESMLEFPANVQIVAPLENSAVLEANLESEIVLDRSQRYAILDTNGGLSVLDLETRKLRPVETGTKLHDWGIMGSKLILAENERLVVDNLRSETKDAAVETFAVQGVPEAICITPEGDTFYVITSGGGKGYLERWSISSGSRKSLAVIDPDSSPKVFDEIGSFLVFERAVRQKDISCNANLLSIDGSEQRVVWKNGDNAPILVPKVDIAQPVPEVLNPAAAPPSMNDIATAELKRFDSIVALKNPANQRWLFVTPEQESRISSAVLLRKRGWLAVGLENGTLRVWNITSPSAPIIDFVGHESVIESLNANSSETFLVTADKGGQVRLWPTLSVAELLKRFDKATP